MKKLLFIVTLIHCTFIGFAQLDITANTQDGDLFDTVYVPVEYTYDANFKDVAFVSNPLQIPAHGLYARYWDTLNIRSKLFDIPFYNDQIKIELVQPMNNGFVFPAAGEVSRNYGMYRGKFHPGIDLSVSKGSPVVSCFDGVVRLAKHCKDYGYTVIIRHYNGLETLYAHLGELSVKPGQKVNAGSPIGVTGKSGNTDKPLLHFETRFLNHYFNPALILNTEERRLNDNFLIIKATDITTIPLPEPPYPVKNGAPIVEEPTAPVVEDSLPADTTAVTTPIVTEPKEENIIEEPKTEAPEKVTEPIEPPTTPTAPAEEKAYHTVQPGETLYRIAKNNNVPVATIIKLNNLRGDGSDIKVGQKLRIK